MRRETSVIDAVKKFLKLASSEIRIKDAYIFGSRATGAVHDNSDIDVAIVSEDFEGVRLHDCKRLIKFMVKASYDLEVHPFRPEEFTPDNPFAAEILRTGKRIRWN
jgi:predicted nucleotidyltransferase